MGGTSSPKGGGGHSPPGPSLATAQLQATQDDDQFHATSIETFPALNGFNCFNDPCN